MNIWVVISWFDWNYGATYSCRALSQSTPLFAFPLAALLTYLFSIKSKLKYLVYPIGIYLIAVNLFQIGQYNSTVLHYYDMNRKYYGAIYLDKNPTPLDMSLLDTDIALYDEGGYNSVSLGAPAEKITHTSQGNRIVLMDTVIELSENDAYLCVQSELTIPSGSNGRHIQTVVLGTQDTVTTTIRLNYPNSNLNSANPYHYYTLLPKNEKKVRVVTQVIVAGKTEVIEENSSFRLLTKK